MATTLEDEVFGSLGLLKLDELLNIYNELGLPPIITEEPQRAVVRKRIMKFLTSDEVENSDDQGHAHFLRIKTYLDTQDIRVSRHEATVAPTVVTPGGPGDVADGLESAVKTELWEEGRNVE